MPTDNEEIKCRVAHVIDGKIPMENDLHLVGRTCDCGKFEAYAERCSCPNNVVPTYTLKLKPNPDYNG